MGLVIEVAGLCRANKHTHTYSVTRMVFPPEDALIEECSTTLFFTALPSHSDTHRTQM